MKDSNTYLYPLSSFNCGLQWAFAQDERIKKLKLTPEEEKEQLAAVLKLTMLTTKLAELKMHHDQVIMQALLDSKKNNNAQPAADSATPVAAAANDTSSNSPTPLKSFTPKDLLAHSHDMNELVERTSSLVSTVIAERLNQLKSNNNE